MRLSDSQQPAHVPAKGSHAAQLSEQLNSTAASGSPSGGSQDAACQTAVERAPPPPHPDTAVSPDGTNGAAGEQQQAQQQADEVAAAAQQIGFHAGAASLARQDAVRLQNQVPLLISLSTANSFARHA